MRERGAPVAREELDAFVRLHGSALLRTASLLAGSRDAGEDLLQTALVRALGAWDRVRAADRPEAYVRAVLVNEQRNRWSRRRPVEYRADLPEVADPSDAELRADQAMELRSLLSRLPRRQRTAVVLRHHEGLPEAEVARLMGVSVGTVKAHASRGLARLRELAAQDLAAPAGRPGPPRRGAPTPRPAAGPEPADPTGAPR